MMRVAMMIEGQEGLTWRHWTMLAKAAEEAKLDGMFRSDHYTSFQGFGGGALDAWTTIAGLAAITKTLRLGTLVTPVTFRGPGLMARIAATADHISNGRVELGLGAGWFDGEHAQNGFPFPSMGERTQMLAEQVEIIAKSWTGETFDFEGKHYRLKGQQALPIPVQNPLPIILGGRGGPRSLALAARYASEYNAFAISPEDAKQHRAHLDAACAKIGRDPKTLPQSTMIMAVVGENDRDAQARLARIVARLQNPETAAFKQMIESSEAGGYVAGVQKIADRLRPMRDAGISRVMVQNFEREDASGVALIGELAKALA